MLPTFALTATALLFIATWLTVVIVNNEDPIQQAITESCAGSRTRVRISKLLFSFAVAATIGILGIDRARSLSRISRATLTDIAAGWARS